MTRSNSIVSIRFEDVSTEFSKIHYLKIISFRYRNGKPRYGGNSTEFLTIYYLGIISSQYLNEKLLCLDLGRVFEPWTVDYLLSSADYAMISLIKNPQRISSNSKHTKPH